MFRESDKFMAGTVFGARRQHDATHRRRTSSKLHGREEPSAISRMSPTTPEPTDAALIARILVGGDRTEAESAYRILTERYWKVVLVLFRSRVSSERDAEDLSQEAFLRAFRSLGQLQKPKLFLGWMLRICRNLATDHLRKRKPETSLEGLGERGADAQPTRDDSEKPSPQ